MESTGVSLLIWEANGPVQLDWEAQVSHLLSRRTSPVFSIATGADGVTKNFTSGTIESINIKALVNALQQQGDVRLLSNPRVNMMNGQTAVLTVGRNTAYISSIESTTLQGTNPVVTFSVGTSSILSGITIGIVPFVNDVGEISLTITPIVSELISLDTKNIGSPLQQLQISLPAVDLRELSTTAKVRDGQIVVIGGLTARRERVKENQTPFLGRLPLLGGLFRSSDRGEDTTELVHTPPASVALIRSGKRGTFVATFRLGDILKTRGLISDKQLSISLLHQKVTGDLLGDIFVRLGFITSRELGQTLAEQFGMEFIDLSEYPVSDDALRLIPKEIAEKEEFIPIEVEEDILSIGVTNPSNITAVDRVVNITKNYPKVFLVDPDSFRDSLETSYFFPRKSYPGTDGRDRKRS